MLGKIIDSINRWKMDRAFNKFKKKIEIGNKMKQELCKHDYYLVDTYESVRGQWECYDYYKVYLMKCRECGRIEELENLAHVKALIKN